MTGRRMAAAALLAVGAALPIAACGSQGDDPGAEAKTATEAKADPLLRVDATEGPKGTELIVYVLDPAVNTTETAQGKRKVTLRCLDKGRKVLVKERQPWPFTDTDNGLTDAHVHQRVPRAKATQVSRCELEGTRGPLAAEVTSTGFE